MTEIKDKIASVSGGVEIPRSSDAYVEGVLGQWRDQIDGTNGVVVLAGTYPATKTSTLVESTLDAQSAPTTGMPRISRLTRVENFGENPSGYGNIVSLERARAKKRASAHVKAA